MYDTVVGLEVHIQLNTQSKAFCGDSIEFGASANTQVSAVSLAHPGTLPVANYIHVQKAIKLGLALGCTINPTHSFDRKHYFYPDLPKGYQITQDAQPICLGGSLDIEVGGKVKTIRLHHIHMEEDAGKTIHDQHDSLSLVDLNRAGTPLMELVTEPDLSSGEEVFIFITELQKILRYIEVSDADMEKGSMRCDCNVSIKPVGSSTLGERCEIKNLNSRRFAREAVQYEAKRQIKMKEGGIIFNKQTLHFDPDTGKTSVMREKEGVADYRYFPDPDLPPLQVSQADVDTIRASLPEMPQVIKARLMEAGLTADYADQLTQSADIVKYYEELKDKTGDTKASANLIINQILPSLGNDVSIAHFGIPLDICSRYLQLISEKKISASMAHQKLWPALLAAPQAPDLLAEQLGLLLREDAGGLSDMISQILADHPDQVKQYRGGKKALIGFFIGAAMKKSGGSYDPGQIKKAITTALENR